VLIPFHVLVRGGWCFSIAIVSCRSGLRTIGTAQAGNGLDKAERETKAEAGRARGTPATIALRRTSRTVRGKGRTGVAVDTIRSCVAATNVR
jgi:hypothetical protein